MSMDYYNQRRMNGERFFRIAAAALFISGCFVALGTANMLHSPPGFLGALIWLSFLARAAFPPLPLVARRTAWLISALWHSLMFLITVVGLKVAGPPLLFFFIHSSVALGISLAAIWHDRPPARTW
jgi:hypothetical protein